MNYLYGALAWTTKMSPECRKILNWDTLSQDSTVTACDRVLVLCVVLNLKVNYHICKSLQLIPILGQTNSIQKLLSCYHKRNFNIFPSLPTSFKYFFPSGFPIKIHLSVLYCACHMPFRSYHPWIKHLIQQIIMSLGIENYALGMCGLLWWLSLCVCCRNFCGWNGYLCVSLFFLHVCACEMYLFEHRVFLHALWKKYHWIFCQKLPTLILPL